MFPDSPSTNDSPVENLPADEQMPLEEAEHVLDPTSSVDVLTQPEETEPTLSLLMAQIDELKKELVKRNEVDKFKDESILRLQGFLIKVARGGRSPTFVVTTKQKHDYDSLPG